MQIEEPDVAEASRVRQHVSPDHGIYLMEQEDLRHKARWRQEDLK